ncbi:MAG TPA: hypothetical protein VNI56_05380, partial [Xanthomonadaceae bacterium]|nr:hypothetical protein [Xanthomonadaceae bacterium]
MPAISPGCASDMIVLEGRPALSPFRRERLEARLRAVARDLRILDTREIYWIQADPATGSPPPDAATLQRILQAQPVNDSAPDDATVRHVCPRLGTVSPWASKATELL